MVRPEAFYADNRIETRFGTTVLGVDAAARTSGSPAGTRSGSTRSPSRPVRATAASRSGIDLPGALDLRTSATRRYPHAMVPKRRVVMAGMGFIGSEVAASLRQRGLEVHVVAGEGAARPGPRRGGRSRARGCHHHGVEMTFDDQVAGFEGNGRVRAVTTANGLRLDCDFVVLGLGVEPVTNFLDASASAWTTGCSSTSTAGRTSTACSPATSSHFHPSSGSGSARSTGTTPVGRPAALNMLGRTTPYDEVPWFWSDRAMRFEYAGYHQGWDDLGMRGSLESRSFAAFYLTAGRVRAVALRSTVTPTSATRWS